MTSSEGRIPLSTFSGSIPEEVLVALRLRYGDTLDVLIEDVIREYLFSPLNRQTCRAIQERIASLFAEIGFNLVDVTADVDPESQHGVSINLSVQRPINHIETKLIVES